MVGLHDFTLCQNAARSDKFCFLCWVDYSLEGSTFWGPFFFYQLGRGGGGRVGAFGMWGGQAEKWLQGGWGGRQKYWVKGEGVTKKILKRFWSDGICDTANNLPAWQKPAFLMFSLKFMFSALSIRMPPVPLLYYAQKSNFTPPKCQKINIQIERSSRKKIISTSIIKKWNSLAVDRT